MKIRVMGTLAVASAILLGAAASANAAVFTAIEADCDPGISDVTSLSGTSDGACGGSGRTDVGNIETFVTGDAGFGGDGDFFSLGLNGALIYEINPPFTGPAMVVEVTNAGTDHREAVEILGSNDLSLGDAGFTSLGTITNINGGVPVTGTQSVTFAGSFQFLAFRDVSETIFPGTGSSDGFDIDAFKVSIVPVPVPLALLLTGIAGIGLLSSRRKAAA